jgi:hypothetical protein
MTPLPPLAVRETRRGLAPITHAADWSLADTAVTNYLQGALAILPDAPTALMNGLSVHAQLPGSSLLPPTAVELRLGRDTHVYGRATASQQASLVSRWIDFGPRRTSPVAARAHVAWTNGSPMLLKRRPPVEEPDAMLASLPGSRTLPHSTVQLYRGRDGRAYGHFLASTEAAYVARWVDFGKI